MALFLSPKRSKISKLLGDNVTSHMSLGLVANGFPQWFATESSGDPQHKLDMLVLKIIYETLLPLFSTLQNILETIDVMVHRIIQESKPFIQRKQLVQSGMSALNLGGTYGVMGSFGASIGGTNSMPNIPVGLVSTISLDGTEYLPPRTAMLKSEDKYREYRDQMRGFFDTKGGAIEKAVIGDIEDRLKIVRNIFPESIDFESYLNNLKGLLFSNASLISKFIYNLELINHGYGEDFLSKVMNDDENVELLWQGYLLNPEYPQLYATIDGMCDRCKEFVAKHIKDNKKVRMEVYSAHPPIQQTFREPNPSIMTCGGPYFGPSTMLATMLPPSYETKGEGTTEDTSRGKSTTDVKSKDMDGNEVLIEVEKETGEDKSRGKTTGRASNTMNLPKGLTEHLGFKSAEIKEDETEEATVAISIRENESSQDVVGGQVLPVPEQVYAPETGPRVEDEISEKQHDARLKRRKEMVTNSNRGEDETSPRLELPDSRTFETEVGSSTYSAPGVATIREREFDSTKPDTFEVEGKGGIPSNSGVDIPLEPVDADGDE